MHSINYVEDYLINGLYFYTPSPLWSYEFLKDKLLFDNFKGVKINANKNPMNIAEIDTAIVISVAINNSSPHPLSPK